MISPDTSHVVAVFGDRPACGLLVAAPSGFARLIAAVGILDKKEMPNMELFECISAAIGDEVLGAPGELPLAKTLIPS